MVKNKISRRVFFKLMGAGVAGALLSGCTKGFSTTAKNPSTFKKPNFVVIFIDDMGYGDIEPFGSTSNKTPHLNTMAEEGVKFTDFYVSWTACTPSRASLLTGCYAKRVGMDGKVNFPVDKRGLNPKEHTIAKILKTRGYVTGCFGKWHLGDQPKFMPTNHGFDEFVGIPYSNDMYRGTYPWAGRDRVINYIENLMPGEVQLPHLPYLKNDKVVAYIPDGENQALICDAVTDAAIDFIKCHKNEPFFAYIPHAAIHGPVFVKDKFVDFSSEKGFSHDVYKEVVSAHIEEVDASVGRVLNTLKELNIDKNTFVFFTSDNGGGKKWSSMGSLRGGKGAEPYEGRMREPAIAWWPGKIPSGKVTNEIVASIDILPTLANIAGAKVPADRQIDGNDVTDILFGKGNAKSPHDVLYHQTDAIRKGDWKLLTYYNKKKKKDCTELYNLKTDIGERNDLSKQYPDKVKELQILLEKHAEELENNIRPAGIVEDPKPLLTMEESKRVPTLQEYLETR